MGRDLIVLWVGFMLGSFFSYPIGAWAARKKAQWDLVKRMWR